MKAKNKLILFASYFLATVFFCTGGAIASEDDCSINNITTIIEVPKQGRSIQEAINQIKDKGLVIINKGTFRENIIIPEGKKIILQGLGAKKTRILPTNSLKSTISISKGAQVCINSLTVKGGKAGIKAGEFLKKNDKPLLGNPAKSITLKYTNIESSENGLLINSEKTRIDKGNITKNLNFGAYIFSPNIELIGLNVFSNLGSGLVISSNIECLLSNTFNTTNISGVEIIDNNGPGLTLCGLSDATVVNSFISGNVHTNIRIHNQSPGSILLDSNYIVLARKLDSMIGYGIYISDSLDVEISRNMVGANDLAGIVFNNSDGEVAENLIYNNPIGVSIFGDSDVDLDDSNAYSGNAANVDSNGLPIPELPPPPEPPDD